ncbi:unnamed protein product [Meloidogyne enterolobii]|uniref:Uncharacterized protein n=1 Tax=Meloidogyne enterolobii TaxID=390850 RepID=A0ACB1AEX8_MELEN
MVDNNAEYNNNILTTKNVSVNAANFYDEWKDEDNMQQQQQSTSQFANQWRTTSRQQLNGGQIQLCHRCRQPGHIISDCPDNNNKASTPRQRNTWTRSGRWN